MPRFPVEVLHLTWQIPTLFWPFQHNAVLRLTPFPIDLSLRFIGHFVDLRRTLPREILQDPATKFEPAEARIEAFLGGETSGFCNYYCRELCRI